MNPVSGLGAIVDPWLDSVGPAQGIFSPPPPSPPASVQAEPQDQDASWDLFHPVAPPRAHRAESTLAATHPRYENVPQDSPPDFTPPRAPCLGSSSSSGASCQPLMPSSDVDSDLMQFPLEMEGSENEVGEGEEEEGGEKTPLLGFTSREPPPF